MRRLKMTGYTARIVEQNFDTSEAVSNAPIRITAYAADASGIMNKFNRKFNIRRKRQERWYGILMRLSDFEGLINNYDSASPEEIRAMRTIHSKLYECCVIAKEHLKEAENYGRVLR